MTETTTTIVVSLFLPYTLDFEDPNKRLQKPAAVPANPNPSAWTTTPAGEAPPFLGLAGRMGSTTANANPSTGSLLREHQPLQIPLPSLTPMEERQTDSYFPLTPAAPHDPAAHFARPKDPRSLVRSDGHVPEWGVGTALFNQPRSRADPVPPNDLLAYAKAQEIAEAQRRIAEESSRPKYRGKAGGCGDPRWQRPYEVVPAVQGNGGLSNAINASVERGTLGEVITVGLIGFPTDPLNEDKKVEIYQKLEEEHKALCVFISDKDFDGHYAHYCKVILWPVFHYIIPDHPKSKAFLDHSWVFYERVNRAFADKVIKNYKRGDVIWVHDYHLCLVPAMIREKLPDAKVGFFLHTAFPSSEVFRCLASRKQLLEGMLGANLVAFQTREYAHHFLQTCSRILGVEAVEDGVQLENRFVNVFDSPIGIDIDSLQKARLDDQVKEWMGNLARTYKGKRLIVARDKLDSIRGVRQKLLAFELFLKKNPEWVEKVVLIQVATSTREDIELATTVSDIVERIEAAYSTVTHTPLVFLRQDIPFSQYIALLSSADVLAITSLREGMNLTCHEFVVCQDGLENSKKHSPVILSEFTGSAAVFDDAHLSINPWDLQGIADKFKEALDMKEDEKTRRWEKMREKIEDQTGDMWIINLVNQLNRVFDQQAALDTMAIPRLSYKDTMTRYEKAPSRIFFLDYEGTLASYGAVQKTVLTGNDKLVTILNELASDPRNIIYITSGRTVRELELLFNRVPGVGLIAENGCYIREPQGTDWVCFVDEEKHSEWKDTIKSILQYYVERVEGSWIEERGYSLIYHYDTSKQKESTAQQAGECANHINDATESQCVRAIPTKDSVIIESTDFDKSSATQHVFFKYPPKVHSEFLFVAGNDRDDESVFKWAKSIAENWISQEVISVNVGDRNSTAMYTLPTGSTGLLSILSKLAKASTLTSISS